MPLELDNLKNICRTCLRNNDQLISVFDIVVSEIHQIRLTDILRKISSVKILKEDGLPQQICSGCINDVGKAFTFAQKCEESDKTLRQYVKEIAEGVVPTWQISIAEGNNSEEVANVKDNTVLVKVESQETVIIKQAPCEEIVEVKLAVENIDLKEELDDYENYTVEYDSDVSDEASEENVIASKDKNGKHSKSAYKTKKYPCTECSESFNIEKSLAKHKKLHDPKNIHKCDDCGKCFSKNSHLKVHKRSHFSEEEKQHQCEICNKSYAYEYQLKQHSFKHTGEKPFPCTECDKGCLTKESLRRHMKTHESDYEKKKHQCPYCNKDFLYPSILAEHMKNHTGEKPFLCSFCGKGFRQSGALDYHIRSHTGLKPYTCEICKNNFVSPGILKVHMRRHTGERPYICDICGVGFTQSSDMKCHKRTHTGEKPVTCPVCEKKMSTTGQLTVHLRSHTGEKPHKCTICFKQFTTRTMLIKHTRIHTGEKPFICYVCGRAFSQNGSLKTHMATHNKEKSAKTKKKKVCSILKDELISASKIC